MILVIYSEMIGERRSLMIGGRGLRGRDDFAFDQFRPAFEFSENQSSGVFIPTSGRDLANEPGSVSELGDVRRAFFDDPQGTILAGGHLGGFRSASWRFPPGELFATFREEFRAGGQRSRFGFLEYGTHDSRFVSAFSSFCARSVASFRLLNWF